MAARSLPQLEFPSAALNASTHREPHIDSEEAVQYERRRVSQELEQYYFPSAPGGSPEESTYTTEDPSTYATPRSVRSRTASSRSRTISQEHLRPRTSVDNGTSIQEHVGETGRQLESIRSSVRTSHWYDSVVSFWTTHVSIAIEEGAHRDHLALERTFLGYLRTSLILVMTGVLTAQLYRLQHSAHPNPDLGFYVIGRPLSIMFIGMAILVMLLGAYRFWKLQNGLTHGKAYSGGWEILTIMTMSALLLLVTFGLVLGVNIQRSLEDR